MLSDLELFDHWCDGDKRAGGELFARHFDALYGFFARRVGTEAEELVQDTFVACLKSRDSFRRESSVRTYLFSIARNLLLNHYRRRGARPQHLDLDDLSLQDLATSVGTRLARDQDRRALLAALRRLPTDDQLLLEMFYWDGMDSGELSEVFGVARGSVRSRLCRARQILAAELGSVAGATASESATGLESVRPANAR